MELSGAQLLGAPAAPGAPRVVVELAARDGARVRSPPRETATMAPPSPPRAGNQAGKRGALPRRDTWETLLRRHSHRAKRVVSQAAIVADPLDLAEESGSGARARVSPARREADPVPFSTVATYLGTTLPATLLVVTTLYQYTWPPLYPLTVSKVLSHDP